MTVRILDVITSCKACPHRQYYTSGIYECRKAMQRLTEVVPIPDWCPLAAYPVIRDSLIAEPSGNAGELGMDAIPQGWVFQSADFSIQASHPTQTGRVMLIRDVPGRKWWHSLTAREIETVHLYVAGTGMTLAEAIANAADAARAQRADEQGGE